MQVKIENQKIAQTINLLYNLSLKGKQSRHRSKFINALREKLEEFVADEKALLKEHCYLDENGEPKTIENGTKWDVKDLDAFAKEKKELYEEERVFEGGDAQGMLKTVKDVLLNCQKEFSGAEAEIYDYLCDQFEKGADEK
ncbi:DUF1617 family protein [Heyndrickxia coagulans]|uniref:DUF1617 family protein n=1 Tax=Heyndrickxia coagulans TaxID=1398 RepID=UPI000D7395C4|nr:DUF1617 family protein [Heyndrickxia coagulans]AWP37763.1 hypothetical protein CYJ15_12615 [Heyndrickxia coagulans]MED4962966.1 DUF1617 family protein [Heyndrickxia coagulans]QDI60076.1 DUF1617 family protein [Heyndrickxia coagulans]